MRGRIFVTLKICLHLGRKEREKKSNIGDPLSLIANSPALIEVPSGSFRATDSAVNPCNWCLPTPGHLLAQSVRFFCLLGFFVGLLCQFYLELCVP